MAPYTEDQQRRARAVLDDVIGRRLAGEQLADEAVLNQYPELREVLTGELVRLRLINAAHIRSAELSVLTTSPTGGLGTSLGNRPLCVRCPHCFESFEAAADTSISGLVCSRCNGQFYLSHSRDDSSDIGAGRVAHFKLVEQIGMGGFGTVWKSFDTELHRTVALKLPRRDRMQEHDLNTFLREARAAAQLQHPHIVRVFEVGREFDRVYIVTDFIDGVSLDKQITKQRLTIRQSAELCLKLALALHHAHENGVIHRDLKPANILIDYDGDPHVTDFGLARREVGEVTVTLEGQLLGTPAYMSPEQARGDGHQADRRSDVYSLGVVLYELITGDRPFRGTAQMLIQQVIHDPPLSPRRLATAVPRDLETIVLKCLEKSPMQRYQTAAEVADELARFIAGKPILAIPCSAMGRIVRWYKRNPNAISLTAGGYTTILGAILFMWSICGILAGVLRVDELSSSAMAELVALAFVFYPVTICFGLATLSGSRFGLIGGFVLTLAWTAATVMMGVDVIQLASLPTSGNQLYQHIQLVSLLGLLAGIAAVLYGTALLARRLNSPQHNTL